MKWLVHVPDMVGTPGSLNLVASLQDFFARLSRTRGCQHGRRGA